MIYQSHTVARYAETDMMGVIHHSVYPIWAEVARTELMQAMGYSYYEIEKSGIMLPVTEIRFQYKAPVFYENKVLTNCAITLLDNRRTRIDYKICVDDKICCIGYTKHIFMNTSTRRSMRIDNILLNKFKKFYHPEFENILS
ncbi:MAG: acyl-CoA thioesterase [Spirochaetota bacterium]|nr:acyl-CoA thioesterase [Spirochaetota bacterium]